MSLEENTQVRDVNGISENEKKSICDYLQGAVYCWCKNKPKEWFSVRDLCGGENFDWNRTPMIVLFEKHKNKGKSDEDAINQIEKLGIPFVHEDVKNGEWIEVKERQARKKRVREVDEIDKKADSFVRKPDKVKPGYKKKMAEQKENFKKRQRRIKKKS